MDTSHEEGCIYCSKPNQFTDEHVFPAGMGGDDQNYLISKGVCGHCNTKVFSAFEATLMRRSLIALARAIHQPKSRNGKNSTYDPIEANIVHEDGRELESSYTEGFRAEVLPQLIYNGETIDSAAANKKDLYQFIDELIDFFQAETIILTEKKSQKGKTKFILHSYNLYGSTYKLSEKRGVDKPPKHCLWIQHASSKQDGSVKSPRIYRRAKGQIVVKASDFSKIGTMLFRVRSTLPTILQDSLQVNAKEHAPPMITTTCLGWSSDCDRAIAKIGINFIAYQEGLETARHPSLSPIKNFILHREPLFQTGFLINEKYRNQAFGSIPEHHHCVALSISRNPNGMLTANVSMVLYGTTGLSVNLCMNGVTKNKLTINYYLINYLENKITRHSFMEYQKLYNASYIEEVTTTLTKKMFFQQH